MTGSEGNKLGEGSRILLGGLPALQLPGLTCLVSAFTREISVWQFNVMHQAAFARYTRARMLGIWKTRFGTLIGVGPGRVSLRSVASEVIG